MLRLCSLFPELSSLLVECVDHLVGNRLLDLRICDGHEVIFPIVVVPLLFHVVAKYGIQLRGTLRDGECRAPPFCVVECGDVARSHRNAELVHRPPVVPAVQLWVALSTKQFTAIRVEVHCRGMAWHHLSGQREEELIAHFSSQTLELSPIEIAGCRADNHFAIRALRDDGLERKAKCSRIHLRPVSLRVTHILLECVVESIGTES
mmetsp:Transcript_15266/g.38585  ORF Transcript_15266/g.38585 Transcript_15266/m.38585 type:complete len:206 (+) Transcript_15266:1894-2511(+)